jgi:hypothetical protein
MPIHRVGAKWRHNTQPKNLFVTLSINDIQHTEHNKSAIMLSAVMLSVFMLIMLSVVMLNVVDPARLFYKSHVQ